MVSWADLGRWDPAPLQDAVGAVNAGYNKLVACSDDLRDSKTPPGWRGAAAGAAMKEVGQLIDGLEEHAADVAALRRIVADVGDSIVGIQNGVKEAENLAAAQHFSIDDGGAIIDNGTPPDTPDNAKEAVAEERKRVAEELKDRVSEVIRHATAIDDEFCSRLAAVEQGRELSNDDPYMSLAAAGDAGSGLGALGPFLPLPGVDNPEMNSAWWASLSPAEQRQMIKLRPELVGNRDGVAAWARSEANLAMVPKYREQLRQELADLHKRFPNPNDPRSHDRTQYPGKDQIDKVAAKLNALNEVETMMYGTDGKLLADRQLLSLDMTGDRAKAAVSVGNVDTAKHVAVFTPGMNSSVDTNMKDYVGNMENVRKLAQYQAGMFGDKGAVAAVTYLGYEPPTVANTDTWNSGFITGSSAHDGADKLAKFYEGINDSRGAQQPHMTALGHSYGSLTTGLALQHPGTGVDNAGFFGSPGIQDPFTGDTGAPKIPEGNSYVLKADGDAVAKIGEYGGRFGGDPAADPRMHDLSTGGERAADGSALTASEGHSQYLDAHQVGGKMEYSTSIYNIANVVAGLPDYVKPAPN